MEERQSQAYESINHETINKDNAYELYRVSATEERRPEEPKNIKKRKNKELTTGNKPIIIIIVLLSLIVILQVVIFCLLLVHMSTRDTTCTAGATTGLPDFNEWANGVSQNTLQLFQNNTNFTELDEQILQTTRDSAQKLTNIVNALSNLQDTSTSTAGVTDDILLIVLQRLVLLENDSFTSCKELKSQYPSSPSGYYVLASANGSVDYTAYCNMRTLCGSGGGWTRLAYLDMSDATQNCPSGLRYYQTGGVRACGKSSSDCASVQFPSNGISYSQICGRVTGYQYGHTDGLRTNINIDSYYVEGVSITRGSPRQHVWSLISGINESSSASNACPCNTGSSVSVQSFIGNNYFCESGSPSYPSNTLYTSDPLWDGQGCGSLESPCCNVPGIPWFHRDYGSNTTTDYIELRVCGDEGTNNDDAPVSYYEIYIK